MNTNDHKRLSLFIIRHSGGYKKKLYQKAFVAGSIEPDYNFFSYIKGSFRHKWLKGHHYSNSLGFLSRSIRHLQKKDFEKWNVFDFYKFGKVMHYLADDFTCAHNDMFKGNLVEHCSYEDKLSEAFNAYLEETTPKKHLSEFKISLVNMIEKSHEKYEKQLQKLSNDTKWIVRMCWLTACQLTKPQAAAI